MSYQGSRFRCKSKRDRLFTEDGYRCAYCLTDLWQLPIESRTVDHILPRKAGGSNDPTNLIAACHSCNSRRRDTPIGQFVGQETLLRLIRDYPRVSRTVLDCLTQPQQLTLSLVA